MKKAGALFSLVVLITILSTAMAFATEQPGKLNLIETYPKDGATGASIENLGVKLYFDSDLSSSKAGKANGKDVFRLYDEKGKALPTRVLYPEKEEGVVLVLLDVTKDSDKDGKADARAESNTAYKLMISKDLVDDKGNVLGKEETVTFKTLNQSVNMWISMGMMVVMFGGMILISFRSAKKTAAEEVKKREEKVNPYKEAKRTGKSVEEIVEKDQKDKAKKAAKEAARAAKEEQYEWIDINTYRVKRPRPIAEAGSTYITGRKAEAEARKAEEAARKEAQKRRTVKKGKGKRKK